MLRYLLILLISVSSFAKMDSPTCYNQYKSQLKDYFHPSQYASAPLAGGMAALTATVEVTTLGAAASGGVVAGAVVVMFSVMGAVQGIQNHPERKMMKLIKDSILYNELQTDPGRILKKLSRKIYRELLKREVIDRDDKSEVMTVLQKSLSAQIVKDNRSGDLCDVSGEKAKLPKFREIVNEVIEVQIN